MSIQHPLDKLEIDLENGSISQEEFDYEMNELLYDLQATADRAAYEAAQQAHDAVMGGY